MRALVLLLFLSTVGCVHDPASADAGEPADASSPDAGMGGSDAGAGSDGGQMDAGQMDAGQPDAGFGIDSGTPVTGPIGWASEAGLGLDTTTGGGEGVPTVARTRPELEAAVAGDAPRVVRIEGTIEGRVAVGSNKTIEGGPGAVFRGSLLLSGVENVIIRDLTLVGYNCSDDACGDGADTITVYGGTHHLWIDHCDISDGSDGNLDITVESDFVTVSWTRFSYSGRRAGGHQLSNLVGASDGATDDAGHLNVTWHHNWWAENIEERMPRVRYGKNHLFNNLYSSEGNRYCVGLGVSGDVLLENNVFRDVGDPVNSTSYSDENSVVESRGNLYINTTGDTDDFGTGVFTPPYAYSLDDASEVEARVRAGAGPRS